jgi:hypothetical protein
MGASMSRSNMNQKVQTMEWITNVCDESMTETESMVYPVFIQLRPPTSQHHEFYAMDLKFFQGYTAILTCLALNPNMVTATSCAHLCPWTTLNDEGCLNQSYDICPRAMHDSSMDGPRS